MSEANELMSISKKRRSINTPRKWLGTRRKDNMFALACKLNIDCDLLVTSRKEVKSRVWQCFERSIDIYL